MKKMSFFLLLLALLLSACQTTPQVAATLPPPTKTPIPTPTLHPALLDLQTYIASSGERFTLGADGTIQDGTETIPDLTIASDGTMTLTLNGETVILDPANVIFDDEHGISIDGYEFDQATGAWEEAVPMTELDQQIFDAAGQVDGLKTKLDPTWGVVGVDEQGNVDKIWIYNPYNLDRGDWAEVVREENGHLVTRNANGVEKIVYPERITINVNGEELTLNTTARGYTENEMPLTPEIKRAIALELIRLSNEGGVLPKLAVDGMTLADYWYNNLVQTGGTIRTLFDIHSNEMVERRPDQLQSAFVLFPHVVDGVVVGGAYDVTVLTMQSNGVTEGYWATVVNFNDRLPYSQQLLDHDMFKSGGTSAVRPIRFLSLADCERVLGSEMAKTCKVAMDDVPAAREAVRSSVASGMVDPRLVSGELTVFAMMAKASK